MPAPLPHLRSVLARPHFQSTRRVYSRTRYPPLLVPSTISHPRYAHHRGLEEPRSGTTTPVPDGETTPLRPMSQSPFYFEAGYALYAKRPSRPFPPAFKTPPTTSVSDPESGQGRLRDQKDRAYVNGEMIRGETNGDDAVLVSDYFIGANDGVGAWASKKKGHAALWSRLILHFWALEVKRAAIGNGVEPDPISYLQRAFEQTKEATGKPTEWCGTTTASGALLGANSNNPEQPMLYITQLGDSQIMVIRPRDKEIIFKTTEQWHWFDCPRQLGTNSLDNPKDNAVLDRVEIKEDDIVLAMTDGVSDNLWDHEIVQKVVDSMKTWEEDSAGASEFNNMRLEEQTYADRMRFVARELAKATRRVAEDPYAEVPYMQRSVDEGLSIEGGKLDDISVVAAQCKRRKG